jgi:hypothetical protein
LACTLMVVVMARYCASTSSTMFDESAETTPAEEPRVYRCVGVNRDHVACLSGLPEIISTVNSLYSKVRDITEA